MRRKRSPAISTILIPTDFSDNSDRAISYATLLAKRFDAKIELIYVIETMAVSEFVPPESLYKVLRESSRTMLDGVLEKVRKKGVGVRSRLLEGLPYDEIVKMARRVHADIILWERMGAGACTVSLWGALPNTSFDWPRARFSQ